MMIDNPERALIGGAFLILAASCAASALPPSPPQPAIKILSTQMDCDQSRQVCTATGNAIAEKLDAAKPTILKADQIIAHFAKEGGSGSAKVNHLEAQGNVFFILGDTIVQGERADYQPDTEVVEVFGTVKITQDQHQLNGSYGQVNLKTGLYSVKQAGSRVQALISAQATKAPPSKSPAEGSPYAP